MTNRSGSFARLWVTRLLPALLVCAGAIAFAPAVFASHDAAGISSLSNGCGLSAPADAHPALITGGALAPDDTDSTDDDDDDGDEEAPGSSVVLPGPPVIAEQVAMEFVGHTTTAVVHTIIVDAHSLRAPPQ